VYGHWQRPLNDTTECLGTVGTGTVRQFVTKSITTPARSSCVANHTCDELWVILWSNERNGLALGDYREVVEAYVAT
jgi:hypothetical protein